MTTNKPKIIRLDASALKDSSCLRRLYWTTVDGLRSKWTSKIEMIYGSAFHIFAEHYYKSNCNVGSSLLKAIDYFNIHAAGIVSHKKPWLTSGHLTAVCQQAVDYLEMDNYSPLIINDTIIVEQKFEIPILLTDEVEIYLTGTMDKIGQFNEGVIAIGDYKVKTSKYTQWSFQEYRASVQLLTYLYALKWHAKEYPESHWNRIVDMGQVGCFIDGVFIQEDSGKVEFRRSEVYYYPQHLVDSYQQMLEFTADQLASKVMSNELPTPDGMSNGACQAKFGLCPYVNMCLADDADLVVALADQDFNREEYNPLKFR